MSSICLERSVLDLLWFLGDITGALVRELGNNKLGGGGNGVLVCTEALFKSIRFGLHKMPECWVRHLNVGLEASGHLALGLNA